MEKTGLILLTLSCSVPCTHEQAAAAVLGILLRVIEANADEAQQSASDAPDHVAIHAHARARDALEDDPHVLQEVPVFLRNDTRMNNRLILSTSQRK